jgi:hypothetical protein
MRVGGSSAHFTACRAECRYALNSADTVRLDPVALLSRSKLAPRFRSVPVVTRERVVVSLQSARSRILKLAGPRPDDPAIWNHLALVDLFLGRNLEYQGKNAEGEAFYAESLMCWDKILEKTPGDKLSC